MFWNEKETNVLTKKLEGGSDFSKWKLRCQMKFLYPDGIISNSAKDPVWQNTQNSTRFTQLDKKIQELKIYMNEDASPKGHVSFTPTGSILFALLKEYIYRLHTDMGCFYLETSTLINYDHPGVKNQIDKAENPTYRITNAKEPIVTRTGVLYCQLAMLCQGGPIHRGSKYRFFETPKVFRLEDEIIPLKKACEFTMADMHEVCSDLDEAMEEAYELHKQILNFSRKWGFDLYVSAKVLDTFFDNQKEWLTRIARDLNKEIMLVDLPFNMGRFINLEYHVNIPGDKPMELSAIQLDFDNPNTFSLRMNDGTVPVLIHSNLIGSVERFMYIVLMQSIKQGYFNPALAPEQIRIIANTERDVKDAITLASWFKNNKLRVTVDDRVHLAVNKRIFIAEKSLIPYVLQASNGTFTAVKSVGDIEEYEKIVAYIENIKKQDKNIPEITPTFLVCLSKWPSVFIPDFTE